MTDIAEAAPEAASGQTETSQVATETAPPATVAETKTEPEKTPATLDDTLKTVWDKHNPPRDPVTKRFISKEAATAEKTETPPEETKAEGQPQKKEEEQPQAAIPAPISWPSEMKAKFASLPPEFADVQKFVAERDKQAHDAISRAGQQIKAFEPIGQVLGRFAETFKRNNLHPAEGIARLLTVEENLQKDAAATVKQIAEAYGVDLHALVGQAPPASEEQPPAGDIRAHPVVQQLEAQLREAKEEIGRVTQYLTAQHNHQATGARNALARQISDFAEAKDERGNLLHPHLDRVSGYMAALMHSNPEMDLETAYNRAVRVDDDLYKEMRAEEARAEEAKRQADARKKAEEARRAAAVNVTSTPGSSATKKTWEDTLQEVAQKHYGR